ncbi:MAG: nucleotide cyclase, partial [Olpidium bornovanus]
GYTATADLLEPSGVVKQLNEFFTAVHNAVESQGGVFDRCIGDGALGVFGAPFPSGANPVEAVLAALQLKAEVDAANKKRRSGGLPTYKYGVGITTGSGMIGSAIKTAFRVEAATREYGCCILICDATRNLVKDKFHLREVDRVMAKGVLDKSTTELETDTETAVICFELGLGEYREQNWEGALSNFGRAVQLLDDGPSKAFIDRCKLLMDRRTSFPDQWDGVYNRST